MPSFVLVSLARSAWLPPLPVPLVLLWPFVWMCAGLAWLIARERPVEAEKLRVAVEVFRELRGLVICFETERGRPVRVWFV